jgi:hypothetical protein
MIVEAVDGIKRAFKGGTRNVSKRLEKLPVETDGRGFSDAVDAADSIHATRPLSGCFQHFRVGGAE